MMTNDAIFLACLVVVAMFLYCQSPRTENFEPGPPCPYRTPYATLDAPPGPDMKAIADMSMLATPPQPSPSAELFSQRSFMPGLAP